MYRLQTIVAHTENHTVYIGEDSGNGEYTKEGDRDTHMGSNQLDEQA